MNDVTTAPVRARQAVVRPRDAASLILLRGQGRDLEVLVGRRPLHLRFMPGVYVFPGGAIDAGDRVRWQVETHAERLGPRLALAARAALRETWEEAGVLLGRPTPEDPPGAPATPIEQAYQAGRLSAAMDLLTYVGRAITPSHSPRRFNTRFFLGSGTDVFGEPAISEEFPEVRWHPIGREPIEPMREVTKFMLARAVALYEGRAEGGPPLFYWAKNARRIGICREGAQTPA